MIVIVILLQWLSNVVMRNSGLKMRIHDLFRGSLAKIKLGSTSKQTLHVLIREWQAIDNKVSFYTVRLSPSGFHAGAITFGISDRPSRRAGATHISP